MDTVLKDLQSRITNALAAFTSELSGIRSNRPTPSLIEDIKIMYFDQETPLKQLGSIAAQPPRDLVLTLWDPSNAETVGKALEDSKRGFSVAVRGASIYVTLPPMTEERRKEVVRLVKDVSEKFRIEIRQIREHANKALATAELSEDQAATGRKKVQEAIDKANKEIEELTKRKETEILE